MTLQSSVKFQLHSLLSLPLLQPPLSRPPSLRPLFLLLRSLKGLARLVTKVRGLRWLRVRGLAKVVLGQRTRARARARRSSSC